jgi:methanogenic corrinoid protein MtbC1
MSEARDTSTGLTIGAVSRATGVPVETLRTWERRYGYPQPERTDSGHRVYRTDVVEPLRRMSQAISSGHRASQVVGKSDDVLDELLGALADAPALRLPVAAPAEDVTTQWLEYVKALDGAALDRNFQLAWAERGSLRFVEDRAGPFLTAIGEAWRSGQIDVYHEHFASERLRDFLVAHWRGPGQTNQGAQVVVGTLPGERHGLGLHMAAVVLASEGCRVTFLGTDTPLADIVSAAGQAQADAVLLSISSNADRARTSEQLRLLRNRLPDATELIVGGTGAPTSVDGARVLIEWGSLVTWAREASRSSDIA